MTEREYSWTRYWYSSEAETTFGRDGLLYRPTLQFTSPFDLGESQQFVETNSLLDIPALILLGEPGMGKSYALRQAYEQIVENGNAICALHDLADFETTDELVGEIFQCDQFLMWQQTDAIYHLFLDSLDEARLHIRTITKKLTKAFQTNSDDLHRLHLRIACRTADWPVDFEQALQLLWGEENVEVYILAPLQHGDVVAAAEQTETLNDANAFWREIVEKEAQPFAARPVTLNFLLDEYLAAGQLPRTRQELYRRGCQRLCAELNPSHEERDKLEPEERFVVAARIAATMIFTGHSSIRIEGLRGVQSRALTTQDCAGGNERLGDISLYIHDSYVHETLDTALFRGTDLREWSHHTYAEFLSAWYVSQALSVAQIESLIYHPEGNLVPQLHETSAWIATLDPEIFDLVLASDPDVLLRSDVATGDDQSRARLTQAILQWQSRNPHNRLSRRQLSVLTCRDLESILQEFAQNRENVPQVRELALDIGIACHVTSLLDLMVGIALDPDESLFLRTTAAQGVVELGDEAAKSQLKPLALLPLEERNLGELKRYGILATWPDFLTAEELFAALVALSVEDYLLDHYASQNWASLILPELDTGDLPVALAWVQQQDRLNDLHFSFSELLNSILFLAWQHVEVPEVAVALGRATLALWERYDHVLARPGSGRSTINNADVLTVDIVLENNEKRHAFLRSFIPIITNHERIGYRLRTDIPVLNFSDAPWLIDYFAESNSEAERRQVAELLRAIINPFDPDQFQSVYSLREQHPDLWETLQLKLFVELNTEEAAKARERYLHRLEIERAHQERSQRQERPPITPAPSERVLDSLDRFESGEIGAWWVMSWWMMMDPTGTRLNISDYEYEFHDLPVWNELNDFQRARIVDSAPIFLQQHSPDVGTCDDAWWEKEKWIYWPIVAGCRALFLLIDYGRIDTLTEADWRKWVPAVTYYIYRSLLFRNEENKRRRKHASLQLFKFVAPEELNETLLWIAEQENEQEHFSLPSRINDLWDTQLAKRFLELIDNGGLKAANEEQVIRAICQYDFTLVENLLASWLIAPIPEEGKSRQRAVIAGQLLLEFTEDAAWDLVWPRIQDEAEFGKEVIGGIVAGGFRVRAISIHSIASRLEEQAIADLSIWLFNQYPPENDPEKKGEFTRITLPREIARVRDTLPRSLAERGTEESVQELRRVEQSLEIDLSYYRTQAITSYLQNTWHPLYPDEFRELLSSRNIKWIQSGGQLLDVVCRLLDNLSDNLQGLSGGLPAVPDLWNQSTQTVDGKRNLLNWPKDENHLSDYVARYLRQKLEGRGIFIGRENQIRRGSYTDIYIQSHPVLQGGELGQTITVVIEVKGCWHRELRTAMEDQLKDRYLVENGLRHGIYLVGRFRCDAWNNEDDSRWKASPKMNDDALLTFLNEQASSLSDNAYDIRAYLLNAKLSQ